MHRLGPFAGLQPSGHTDSHGISVQGLRMALINSAEAHVAVEGCLVPWMDDESNLMDRYDARMLLDDLSSFDGAAAQQHEWAGDDGVTAEELDAERYADLDPIKAQSLSTAAHIGCNGAFP